MATPAELPLDVIGRVLIALSFLISGSLNLRPAAVKDHIERMAAFHTPLPSAAFWIGQAMLFAGCLMILTGWRADIGAGLLIAFTLFATAIFHRFWQITDPMKRTFSRITFLGNTAIAGGLLLVLHSLR
jgi:uncharacterized membrane protein YphA (DoxX/SURF4 family)